PNMLAVLSTRQEAQARVHVDPPVSLSPEAGAGFPGQPGVAVHRSGAAWAVASVVTSVDVAPGKLVVHATCAGTAVQLTHTLELDDATDVLRATTMLTNVGDDGLDVATCNAPAIPLSPHLDQITSFEGRWSLEFQRRTVQRGLGQFVRENRSGRTSHDAFPGLLVHEASTGEQQGEVYGLHLGWSGNHRLCVEELADGRVHAQCGELLMPGEIRLGAGESYASPVLYGVYSNAGVGRMSRAFHRYVRAHLTDERMRGKLKPVHFNTWEAMYFDLSLDKLKALADSAAAVGVERFVLDDGWFGQRKSDRAGLGDWFVANDVFPDGLTPLIDHVHHCGMEFGLWVEPEMVNPDSDLYRAHPDWVLHADPAPRVVGRHQLVLDLTRSEVAEYLFERLDALLGEYPITYLKWDMNRDVSQPGDQFGRAAVHRQTHALYALLARVRQAHPRVEIESCSSGGGRADFGVLAHTDRVWTSDSNDALDRLAIQEGFSVFFPPEIMGAHVGPRHCHITGRTLSMDMRAGVAMFGDMGIEANLLEMSAEETRELKAAVALHKAHRALLFGGDTYRLQLAPHERGFGVVSQDKNEALFSYALLASQPRSAPGRYRFAGLNPDAVYTLNVIWPEVPKSYSASILEQLKNVRVSGQALMRAGLQLPISHPETVLVFHLAT
ncbi:MAG: alpha-galactosidase, partial [Gammaproteobacteria bacterium]